MSIHNALRELETRIAGLQALIVRRESQHGSPQHEGTFSDTSKHIAATRKELHDVAVDYIALKCGTGGGWDPLAVIKAMTGGA